ncbi:MAG: Ppx/GppA phosphatase family protein, partial [Robiginitomaculum sp.]
MSDEHTSAKASPVAGAATPVTNTPKRRRRRRNAQGKTQPSVFGAVDLGTNNCRLLVAKPVGDSFRVIDSYSRTVRLGAGLASSGALSQTSMDAAVEAIAVCASKMKHNKVRRWRCIATQACRQASNGEEFLARVKAKTGLTFELISPRVESRLAVMGCVALTDMKKDVVLVVDIGGGSSELSWVDVRKLRSGDTSARIHRPPISAWASLPVGVVTLSEAFPEHGDSPQALAERYEAMKDHVRGLIIKAGCETRFTKAFKQGQGHIIGTSGTITSLAGIHLGLPYYQRDRVDGLWMQSIHALNISRRMASLPKHLRAEEPCIGDDRASLLVAGCAIMDVLLTQWPAERIRVADRGLREG